MEDSANMGGNVRNFDVQICDKSGEKLCAIIVQEGLNAQSAGISKTQSYIVDWGRISWD